MRSSQKRVAITAILLVALINAWSASGLSYLSNSVQHPVGPNLVSVYAIGEEPALSTVPVEKVTSKFIDTGQRVSVYLRNDYCSASGWTAPRLTLLIVAVASLLFWILSGLNPRREQS